MSRIVAIEFRELVPVPSAHNNTRDDRNRITPGAFADKGLVVEEHGPWFHIVVPGKPTRRVPIHMVKFVEYAHDEAAEPVPLPVVEAVKRGPGRPPKLPKPVPILEDEP